jgi:HSP20 family molecular chaperone IbpA
MIMVEKKEERIRISPEVCTYNNEDNTKLVIEVSIPGVKKEDINLRVQDERFALNAPREDLEFSLAMSFCCPVKATEAEAHYNNGLLKIEAPYKDAYEDAVKVKVA